MPGSGIHCVEPALVVAHGFSAQDFTVPCRIFLLSIHSFLCSVGTSDARFCATVRHGVSVIPPGLAAPGDFFN